jgi:hypothetical protein
MYRPAEHAHTIQGVSVGYYSIPNISFALGQVIGELTC